MAKEEVKPLAVDTPSGNVPSSELQGLMATLAQMQERLERVEGGTQTDVPKRKPRHVRAHTATMREAVNEKGAVVGLVTKLYSVREVRDTKENKKFYGLCTIDFVEPTTGKTGTLTDIDYIKFLEEAPSVLVNIDVWKKNVKDALDKNEGGGGRGMYLVKDSETGQEKLSREEIDYWIEYPNDTFTVTVKDGAYKDVQFQTDGLGFNI